MAELLAEDSFLVQPAFQSGGDCNALAQAGHCRYAGDWDVSREVRDSWSD